MQEQIEAIEVDKKGFTCLCICVNTMSPKQPRRSIRIKAPEGRLQSDDAELSIVCFYFQNVFPSAAGPIQSAWCQQRELNI